MDDHHESPQPEQAFCTYVVIIHIQDDTDPDDIVRVAGVFMNFKDAVACLKNQRLTIEDGFIPPKDAASRDQHPFRNRIGHLERSDGTHIGWGYSWADADSGETATIDRIYLEKTNIAHGNGELVQCLGMSREEVQVLEAESDIDYVAGNESHYFAEGARFDEKTKELIYSSEEEDDSHEVEPETRDNGTASVMDWMADMESSAFDRRIHML